MLKKLKRIKAEIYYYENSIKIIGKHKNITGNVSEISGNVNGLSGNVNECEITADERTRGINIAELVGG